MITRKLVFCGAILLFSGGMSVVRAQGNSVTASGSQSDSLGDAARKARAQKKRSGKPAKVFTNDNLGRIKDTPSVVGNQSAPASGTDRAADKAKDKKPG